MSKAAISPKTESPEPLAPSDWQRWREYGFAPIWMAALLSLNIRPTLTIRSTLKSRYSEQHTKFLRRCKVLDKNYGHHDLLPYIDHKDSEEGQYGQVVDLKKLCSFAREKQLDGIESMLTALEQARAAPAPVEMNSPIPQQPQISLESSVADPVPDALADDFATLKTFEFEELEKGTQYTLQTLGALLIFVEEFLTKSDFNKTSFLKGRRINASQVGARLEKILVAHAVVGPDANVHTKGTLARRISAALNLVQLKTAEGTFTQQQLEKRNG